MKKLRKRIISLLMSIVTVIAFMPVQQASAITEYNGGYALSLADQEVYYSATSSAPMGRIYKNEGITVLRAKDNWAQIEYSTSNGPKQGYLINPKYNLHVYDKSQYIYNSSVASVKYGTSVYYGPSTSIYQRAGSVSAGEYVVAFGASNGWAYIEYNTTSGRKRGYVAEASLDIFYWNRIGRNLQDAHTLVSDSLWIPTKTYVYAGPSSKYVQVGYVQNEKVIEYSAAYSDADGNLYGYIEYYVNGTSLKKSGFIKF